VINELPTADVGGYATSGDAVEGTCDSAVPARAGWPERHCCR